MTEEAVHPEQPEQMIGAPMVCLLELDRDGELCGCCETAITGGTQVIAFVTDKGPRAAHPLCFYRQRAAHLEAEVTSQHQTICTIVASRGGVLRVTSDDAARAAQAKFDLVFKVEPSGVCVFRLKEPPIILANWKRPPGA